MHLGEDFYDSFIEYQTRLLREFDRMTGEYGFQVIDASRPVRRVSADLRRAVKRIIDGKNVAAKEDVGTLPVAQEEVSPEATQTISPEAKELERSAPR